MKRSFFFIFPILLTLTLASQANAQAPSAQALTERLAACGGSGEITRVEAMGDGFFVGHLKADKRAVFAGRSGCTIALVGRALARLKGKLAPGVKGAKLFVASTLESACQDDVCPVIIVLRDGAKRYRSAVQVPGCDGARLEAVNLFGAHHLSAQLTCKTSAGVDAATHLYILHATGDKVAVVHRSFAGYSSSLEADGQVCERGPVGKIEVVQRGASPVLEVFAAAEEPPEGDAVHGSVTSVGWDGARFVQKGEAAAHKVTPKEGVSQEAGKLLARL